MRFHVLLQSDGCINAVRGLMCVYNFITDAKKISIPVAVYRDCKLKTDGGHNNLFVNRFVIEIPSSFSA